MGSARTSARRYQKAGACLLGLQANRPIHRLDAEVLAAAVVGAARLLGPELSLDGQVEVTLDAAVDRLELVPHGGFLVKSDVYVPVHGFEVRLLEVSLEGHAERPVDGGRADRALDVFQLDRSVDGLRGKPFAKTDRLDAAVARLDPDFRRRGDVELVIHGGQAVAPVEEAEETPALRIDRHDLDSVAHLADPDLGLAQRLLRVAAPGGLHRLDAQIGPVPRDGLDAPVDVLDGDLRDTLHGKGLFEDLVIPGLGREGGKQDG